MSLEAIGAAAPKAATVMDVDHSADKPRPMGLHSPPESNNAMTIDGSDSELSDLEDVADKLNGKIQLDFKVEGEGATAPAPAPVVEDIGPVLPDHWSGTVPVFTPTMSQFKDFKRFMEKVDRYGMKSGIIKIVPPDEWKKTRPNYEELVKQIRVREPIKQEIMGTNGTYRQVNLLHQRIYNLPQWRQLCDQSEHQPPARRGERRANTDAARPAKRTRAAATMPKSTPPAKRRGRPPRKAAREETVDENRPLTPESPAPLKEEVVDSVEQDPGVKEEECDDEDDAPVVRRMGAFSRQSKPKMQSVSARRKYVRREGSAMVDEAAFKDWDYAMDISDYTPERCEELERTYWKTLTYASPLYGADLAGTLFDDSTEIWNLNKLPNLLDVLGTKVPGVNTAYLYLGMWKATFAWHLEDVDLYSINYLHFGAPKQWYSISQGDARRFEAVMKSIWPTEAKACDQFLRHKSFLISPSHLKQHYNITVNKCVSYPGEFVVTYPYGYHSGYNLGYNCAEAVNFALDSWLPMGKIAKKCQCAQAQDSVWVDVYEIERKLRGEESEFEDSEEEDEEDEEEDVDGLPTPTAEQSVKARVRGRKRKRRTDERDGRDGRDGRIKKIRLLRARTLVQPPCCLCPNDIPGAEILPTDDGRRAHRMCALYLPETYIETVEERDVIANAAGIDKARLELKCLYCHSRKGACFQCSQKKCSRAYHPTCAAPGGVFVEDEEVPVFGADGTEYKEQAFEFSCRFHRTKRDKKYDGDALEDMARIRDAAAVLKKNDICQWQYGLKDYRNHVERGDIFAGVVVENRPGEETVLMDVIPNGDRVEMEWKWLLVPDAADYRLPKASANAKPMPTSRKDQQELNAKRDDLPRKDEVFGDGLVWAEFQAGETKTAAARVKVDLWKENQIWHYLGKTSTEAKARYTEDPAKPQHNPKSNYLDTLPKPAVVMPPPAQPRRSYTVSVPGQMPVSGAADAQSRPYVYKPRKSVEIGAWGPGQHTGQKLVAKVPGHGQEYSQQPAGTQPVQGQGREQGGQQGSPPARKGQGVGAQYLPVQANAHAHVGYLGQPTQGRGALTVGPTRAPIHKLVPESDAHSQARTLYSSDRFAAVGGSNGFPQLPGLTGPSAHMKSGHSQSQSQSRDWPPAKGPLPARMTSSQQPAAANPGAESTRQKAYQKYSFYHVHHNRCADLDALVGSRADVRSRDSSRYRTPYGSWGGFTNGYEGNLHDFLAKARKSLSGSSDRFKAIPQSLLQPLALAGPMWGEMPAGSHGPTTVQPNPGRIWEESAGSTGSTGIIVRSGAQQSPTRLNPGASPSRLERQGRPERGPELKPEEPEPEPEPEPGLGCGSLHPAIRPQYASSWQHSGKSSQGSQSSHGSHGTRMSPQSYAQSPGRVSTPSPVGASCSAAVSSQQSHTPPLPSYVSGNINMAHGVHNANDPSLAHGRPGSTPGYAPCPQALTPSPLSATMLPLPSAMKSAATQSSVGYGQATQPWFREEYENVSQSQPVSWSQMVALPSPGPRNLPQSSAFTSISAAPISSLVELRSQQQQLSAQQGKWPQREAYDSYEAHDEMNKPEDPSALVQQLMLNLKRASGGGSV